DIREHGNDRRPRGRPGPRSNRLGGVAHRRAEPARQQDDEQQYAPDEPRDARPALQTVVAVRFVLIHSSRRVLDSAGSSISILQPFDGGLRVLDFLLRLGSCPWPEPDAAVRRLQLDGSTAAIPAPL